MSTNELSEPGPDWAAVKAWRKAQRAELLARRESVPANERKAWDERITGHLVAGFDVPAGTIVGLCWPFRNEYDARFPVREWRNRGAITALPEVVDGKSPLVFRKWWPGAPLRPGVYDIPVPDGTDIVVPDVAIVPMNAFDARGYRLGYGGGFFDRTLHACGRRLVAIGVSFEILRVPTIHPQAHDIPMDFVVTEGGINGAGGEPLEPLDPPECRRRFERLLGERGLPRANYRGPGFSSPACYAAEFPGYFGEPEGK